MQPHPDLQHLLVWPAEDQRIGPDFNDETFDVIRNATDATTSRRDFAAMVKDYLTSDRFFTVGVASSKEDQKNT